MENYTSDSSDSETSTKTIDLAYLLLNPQIMEDEIEKQFANNSKKLQDIENMILHHNELNVVPKTLSKFLNLKVLDLSNNGLTVLPDVFKFCQLTNFTAKNNLLDNNSLPKDFTLCPDLKELNLSGNRFEQFPEQIFSFLNLRFLYLGGNGMKNVSRNMWKLKQLQVFSVGGNQLTEVPSTLGHMPKLQALVLCDNQIETLPANIANLHNLKQLLLHKNRLRTLPPEIIALRNLTELSLRDNPLVVGFITDMSYNPASLLEVAARAVKLHDIQIKPGDVPERLRQYMNSACRCVNPDCKGVYFDSRVEHIKFVDFCGMYRIPLLEYLCSSKCATRPHGEPRSYNPHLIKKVLLGQTVRNLVQYANALTNLVNIQVTATP